MQKINTFGTHPTLYGHSVMLKNFSYLLVSATYQIQTAIFKNGGTPVYGKHGVNRRMSRSRNTINIVNTML